MKAGQNDQGLSVLEMPDSVGVLHVAKCADSLLCLVGAKSCFG